MAKLRIGISGWRYSPWRRKFYPTGLPQRLELHYASRQFDSIEINGSFYSLQHPHSWRSWYRDTPHGFVFAVKAPRFITHIRRLRDVERPLANFLASGVLELREKLGPILWQFPPSLAYDHGLFDAFLSSLPKDSDAAFSLARCHDNHLKHVGNLSPDRNRRLRHAIEIRHESFADPAFITLLRKHGAGLVISDAAAKWPKLQDITGGFVYMRLHGDTQLYASGYTDAALDDWARRIRSWMNGKQPHGDGQRVSHRKPPARKSRDIYCYFDNDAKVKAPFDAMKLRDRLNGGAA
ncbi:uncharacterized protein YecE (DUF72 family) [Luteibacter rhizovicinus]|uniref:Uncharacterized protein YecE (DUF72 family) n=1 Tax=Luteibacter rhizovicinus TaxID=242606 RepID=A0A4V2W4Z1_9GAMM|nr:DUF72 domain-containing protein [Luteibacter rhizovicinus]TCV97759.1 uncharacterized protein YecE (DUF72 family) [Luteibacter rhizovicinus]